MAPLFTANWFNFGKNPAVVADSGSAAPPYAGPWVSATGGNASPTVPANQHQPGDWYRYHVFTSPGNLVVSAPGPVDILLIGGGGGGGGGNRGAAAGAGGLVFRPGLTLPTATYPITIGAGGEAGNYSSTNSAEVGGEGAASQFGSPTQSSQRLIGMGGGRGGCADPNNPANHGRPGGSGGSSWYPGYPADPYGEGKQTNEPTIPADSRTYGFGSDCGTSGSSPVYSAGGGGAGGAGQPFDLPPAEEGLGGVGKYYDWADTTAPTNPGDGLAGFPFSPYNGKFAGGGTAGDYNSDVRAEPPGPTVGGYWYGGGLGDNLANPPNSEPKAKGGTNTGGGGGASGDGGPGLCIVRYSIQSQ